MSRNWSAEDADGRNTTAFETDVYCTSRGRDYVVYHNAECACAGESTEAPFARRLPVHPFPPNLDWINVARPIELRELRGKFVLLDFWTLGCINCMHIIPELRKLEKAWPNELVVIGVHSAKFESERDSQNIKAAVLRYRIKHPVVNDSQFAVWNSFGVQAWPSLVLIDPEGYAVWGHSGEATFEQIDAVLRRAVPFYRRKGTLDEKPRALGLESDNTAATPLRFPGKVLADEAGGRLLIADSGHNRIRRHVGFDGTLHRRHRLRRHWTRRRRFHRRRVQHPARHGARRPIALRRRHREPSDSQSRSRRPNGDDHCRHGPPKPQCAADGSSRADR